MIARNQSITHGPGVWAPVYDRRHWKRGPVRLPEPAALAAMPNGAPFFVPLFDTASLLASLSPAGQLGPMQSYENNFQMTVDFWWCETMHSFSSSGVSPAFAWQVYSAIQDGQGNQQSTLYQKTPIASAITCGTAKGPFVLREPIHLPVGTELICQVQNLKPTNNTIQLVLMGYLAEG
jgi:hypothetical protein